MVRLVLLGDLFLPVAALGEWHALVGDPGQTSPVVDCDITRWAHDPAGPHVAAPRALLARHSDVAVVRLPISRRLVPDTVAVVQPAFYPDFAFDALARPDERRIALRNPGRPGAGSSVLASAALRVLSRVASGASVLQVELPPSRTPVVADPAVADALVALVASAADGFHLDPGRFCVMLSRHRGACVIVGRTGADELLDTYVPGPPLVLGAIDDPEYEGWVALRAVLTHLAECDRVAPW